MKATRQTKCDLSSGQILLELLLAIAIAVILLAGSATLVSTGILSSKSVGDQAAALAISEEGAEEIRSAAMEKWQSLYGLTKNSNYYATTTSGKWAFGSGTESRSVNGVSYSQSFLVQNVCRNFTTDAVTGLADSSGSATTCSGAGGSFDPSTQKVTQTVSWGQGSSVSKSEYITRWQNKICSQTAWNTAGSGAVSCPSTLYQSITNISTGTSLQICSGC